MFTPMEELSPEQQVATLRSLDALEAWGSTWDIGLTDPGDSFGIAPLWGHQPVNGRWPAAFPRSRHSASLPWRAACRIPYGHVHPVSSTESGSRTFERSP